MNGSAHQRADVDETAKTKDLVGKKYEDDDRNKTH